MAAYSPMKLHILGCYSPYPPAHGAGPGYLLQSEDTKVLLDCGSGVVSKLGQVCDVASDELSAVILSHLHADHFCDLLVLRYARFLGMRAGKASTLPVFAPKEPAPERSSLPFLDALNLATIEHGSSLQIGDLHLSFASTLHPYPTLAVKASIGGRTLVYTGDTAWHEPLVDFCQGADLLLAEASFLEENKGANAASHLSAHDAGRLAELANVKRLVLTHFYPPEQLHLLLAEAQRQFSREIVLARSGLVITV